MAYLSTPKEGRFYAFTRRKGTDCTDLLSNMGADYEAAFGDIFDVTLTGVIDRDLETVEKKDASGKVKKQNYATDTVRKLYFRGTTMIDAGGRFADGSVPEYMVFDKPNMGAEFVRVVEEGMAKSKTNLSNKASAPVITPTHKSTPLTPDPIETGAYEIDEDLEEESAPVVESNYPDNLLEVIRDMFKECKDADLKKRVKGVIAEYGKLVDVDEGGLHRIYDMMN